jgi:hypothetical protein
VWPKALEGRSPPRVTAVARLGVAGRPNVGDVTRLGLFGPAYTEPGRASREGDRPACGRGEDERGGVVPINFFCVRVSEKMACEREDCAFISVSLVRRIDVPLRIKLEIRAMRADP